MTQQNPSGPKAWVGRHVILELKDEFSSPGDVERLEVDLVPDKSADFSRGFLGESTPLAKAILGRQAGDVVTYQAGGRVQVRILEVSGELTGKPEDLSGKREEAARKALQEVDDTNAILFASSFSGKWGDYDPNAVNQESKDENPDTDSGAEKKGRS